MKMRRCKFVIKNCLLKKNNKPHSNFVQMALGFNYLSLRLSLYVYEDNVFFPPGNDSNKLGETPITSI